MNYLFVVAAVLLAALPLRAQFPYAGPEDETALVRNLAGNDSSYAALNTAGNDLRLGFILVRSHDYTKTGSDGQPTIFRNIRSWDAALRSDENVAAIGLNYRPGLDLQYGRARLRWAMNDARQTYRLTGGYLRAGGMVQQYLFLFPPDANNGPVQRMRYSGLAAVTAGYYFSDNTYAYGERFSVGVSVQPGLMFQSTEGLDQLSLADSFALVSGSRYARITSENPVWNGKPGGTEGFVQLRLDGSVRLFAVGKASAQRSGSNYNRYSAHLLVSAEQRFTGNHAAVFSAAAGLSITRYGRPVVAVLYRATQLPGGGFGKRQPVDGFQFGTAFSLGL